MSTVVLSNCLVCRPPRSVEAWGQGLSHIKHTHSKWVDQEFNKQFFWMVTMAYIWSIMRLKCMENSQWPPAISDSAQKGDTQLHLPILPCPPTLDTNLILYHQCYHHLYEPCPSHKQSLPHKWHACMYIVEYYIQHNVWDTHTYM